MEKEKLCECNLVEGLTCSDCPKERVCNCQYCKGKNIQVDPVGCGCTECITGEYRPAVNETDYNFHNPPTFN